jgi:hypothetical protein
VGSNGERTQSVPYEKNSWSTDRLSSYFPSDSTFFLHIHFFSAVCFWIGHILRRNCLLKHVFEGKLEGRIEMTGRRGRRRKQLLDDLKEKRRYW